MKDNIKPQRKTTIVLLLVAIAAAMYLISIKLAYPVFQNTRLIDPLAEIHSLPALYYIAIAMIAAAGFICLIYRIQNKGIHILLLILLAIMLWYTPYYLAEFVKMPGSPWHVGVAMHIPEVLAGQPIAFSSYAQQFPGSFIFHYLCVNIPGIEPMRYIYLFPLFSLCLFLLLCYTFISRLFSPRVAFLSLLLAIPCLHYFELHPSPHVLGLLLMMTVLVLLMKQGIAAVIVAVIVTLVMITSHPITPLLLCVFLGAGVVTSCLYHRKFGKAQAALAAMLVFCFAGWFLWPTLQVSPPGAAVAPPGAAVAPPALTEHTVGVWEDIRPESFETTHQLLVGETFIYSGINNLKQGTYFLYGLLAVAALIYVLLRAYSKNAGRKKWLANLGGLNQSEIFMTLSALLFLILTVLLIERHAGLTERSLSFLILSLSCVIASITTKFLHIHINKKSVIAAPIAVLLFLATFSFPLGAYGQEAYTGCPASEENGLEFLSANVSLNEKTISMGGAGQLAFYSPYSITSQPGSGKRDLYAFRSTDYYRAAMRQDLSFEDNRFTRLLNRVEADSKYNKVYCNPAFQVYLRGAIY